MYFWHPGRNLGPQTIGEILATMPQEQTPDTAEDIPEEVRMVENPEHPFYQLMQLPGGSTLERHDPLHILLEKGTSMAGEAFTLGLSMGADTKAMQWQLDFYIWWVTNKTKKPLVFGPKSVEAYWLGVQAARDMKLQDIHLVPLEVMHDRKICEVRAELGLDMDHLRSLYDQKEVLRNR